MSAPTPDTFSNFGTTTVAGGAGGLGTSLGASDTSLYLATGGMALMPGSTPYRLLIGQAVSGSGEIVKVTATGSNPLTIVRAQESTSAATWPVGTNVQVIATAGELTNIWTALDGLANSHYITGMGGQNDSLLPNVAIIPGLSGSPDIRNVSNANSDEFDYNSASTPTGWTLFGGSSPAASTNTFLSHVEVSASRTAANSINGIYKAAPSIPYTVTVKISDGMWPHDYVTSGLVIMDATTTNKALIIGLGHNSGTSAKNLQFVLYPYTNWTLNSSTNLTDTGAVPPCYIRATVNAANNIDTYYSWNGQVWNYLFNSTFLSNATYVGLGIDTENTSASNNNPLYLVVDWIRFS